MTGIEHFTSGESHGPVAAFLSDSGRIAFVCRRDGAYWEGEMPQVTQPSEASGSAEGGDAGDSAGDVAAGRTRGLGTFEGAGMIPLADARATVRERWR